jgi:NitT/TauT family transport system ATP-binding protein
MLEIKKLSYKHSNGKKAKDVFVFDDFDLRIKENQFVTVFGPSGCGKSTLINLVAGYIPTQKGKIIIKGKVTAAPGVNRIVINQQDDLFYWLTVEQNMKLVTTDNQMIDKYLKLLNLDSCTSLYPRELSGGMKKRLSLARALVADGDFILMDEPFSALDLSLKEKIHIELLKLKQETNKTFLMVTHDVEEAIFLSDRIIILSNEVPSKIVKDLSISFDTKRDLSIKKKQKFFNLKNDLLRFV